MPVYDTYSAIRRLMETGIPEEQAIAIVREQFTFVESIATKDDIKSLREELLGVRDGLRAELLGVRDGLRADLLGVRDGLRADLLGVRDGLRTELLGKISEEMAQLRTEYKSSELRLIKYFTGLAIAMSGAIVTLLKIL